MTSIEKLLAARLGINNTGATKLAGKLLIGLILICLLDVVSRLLWTSRDMAQPALSSSDIIKKQGLERILLSTAQVSELLSWSDLPPKVLPAPVKIANVTKATTQAKLKVDVHAVAAQTIKSDRSKHLIGDEIFSLKGLFYDGKKFAVVEIENIVTKQKQYYRANVNQPLGSHQLAAIGKDHVVIKNGETQVTLVMFDHQL